MGASWYHRPFKNLEITKEVSIGIVNRFWLLIAAPITVYIIAAYFTKEIQGFYYTFRNLLALKVFTELGLGTVIIQFASHEWSDLRLNKEGNVVGSKNALDRLISLGRFSFRWYIIAASVLFVILTVVGFLLFSEKSELNVDWKLPWLALCLVTSLDLCLVPIFSILIGCNQVFQVYSLRLVQAILMYIGIWVSVGNGAELWAAPVGFALSFMAGIVFLIIYYRNFLITFFKKVDSADKLSWQAEIWPMQWKIAVSWLSGYFVFSLFTPVLFHFHGPELAGQMGMTWSLVAALGFVPSLWVKPNVPRFGMLIAKREFKKLDGLFFRLFRISFLMLSTASIALWGIIYLLNNTGHPISARLLPLLPTSLFIIATVVTSGFSPMSDYLRAHKKEPLMILSVIAAVFIGSSTIILGKLYGANGVSTGYLVINILLTPFIVLLWSKYRRLWHQ